MIQTVTTKGILINSPINYTTFRSLSLIAFSTTVVITALVMSGRAPTCSPPFHNRTRKSSVTEMPDARPPVIYPG